MGREACFRKNPPMRLSPGLGGLCVFARIAVSEEGKGRKCAMCRAVMDVTWHTLSDEEVLYFT